MNTARQASTNRIPTHVAASRRHRWALHLACGLASLGLAAASRGAATYRVDFAGVPPGWIAASGFEHALAKPPGQLLAHADLVITKPLDQASPALAERWCDGQPIPTVRLEAREVEPAAIRYFKIELSDVLITSIHASGPTPTSNTAERVAMNYGKIEWTIIQTDAAGQPGHATSTYWDVGANSGGASDPDSDDDGIPDGYEVNNDLKPLDHDADLDKDGDGLTNLEEFQAGTSAADSNSVLRVSGVSIPQDAGFNIQITFESVPGRTYDLYATAVVGETPTFVQSVTAITDTTPVDLNLAGNLVFILVRVQAN